LSPGKPPKTLIASRLRLQKRTVIDRSGALRYQQVNPQPRSHVAVIASGEDLGGELVQRMDRTNQSARSRPKT